jgi:aminoglycoside 3-N-acetyltransferase I
MEIRRLSAGDRRVMEELLDLFAEVFQEPRTYGGARPSAAYQRELLGDDTFVALVAIARGKVVGGLAAYELRKFEQERSEFYLYDLAVVDAHRRRGVATALIESLKVVAAERGGYVIFVQADWQEEAPVALYSKLGRREDVHHFDIAVE